MKTKRIDRVIFNCLKIAPLFIVVALFVITIFNTNQANISLSYSYIITDILDSVDGFIALPIFMDAKVIFVERFNLSNDISNFLFDYMGYLVIVSCVQLIYRLIDLPFHICNNVLLDKFAKNKDE